MNSCIAHEPLRTGKLCFQSKWGAEHERRGTSDRHLLPGRHLRSRFRRFCRACLYMAALDTVGMPDDEPFRETVRQHVEFGSRVAMQNSHAECDEDLYPLHEVPRWHWAGDQ